MSQRPHVVVIGGGITGLTAAWRLITHCDVTVVEGSERVGGKLRSEPFGDALIDVGAEAFLARRPEVPALLNELGMGFLAPVTGEPGVLVGKGLRELPRGTVLGVPGDLGELRASGVLSTPGLVRAWLDRVLPPQAVTQDISVGELVATRVGREVVERLVDPLLGGVYAASADDLSLEAVAPQLAAALREPRRLLEAAASLSSTGEEGTSSLARPVFGSVIGGMGALPVALRALLQDKGAVIRTGLPATELRQQGRRWSVTVGSPRAVSEELGADAVLLACPAPSAAKLLGSTAGRELAQISYASMAIISLAYRPEQLPSLGRSGYLVPAASGRVVKAVTLTSEKWGAERYGTSLRLLRASVGRLGESAALQLPDPELTARVVSEIEPVIGALAPPVETMVTRWGGGLPQYAPGHLGRIARVREALSPRVRIAGAALDGVGIPACIASATAQAQGLLRDLDV